MEFAMRDLSWNTKLAIFTFCIFFTSASYTMCIPFLPVYLLELGAPEEDIEIWSAVVFSVCFLIAGIMAPIWGKISDLKGKKSMAMRSSILLCISYGLGGVVTAPIQLFFMRVLQGFANGYLPVVLSMVSSGSPKERLGTSLSIIQSAQLIGTVGGPLLGGILANIYGYRASFIIASACLALVVVVTYLMPESKDKSEITTEKTSIFQDLKTCFSNRDIFEVLALFFCFQMVMLGLIPLLSLFVAELNGSYEDVSIYAGIAVSVPTFIGALSAPMWGYLGQRHGFYKVMAVALLGAGIFICAESFSPTFTILMVISAFHGFFIVGIVPSLNAALTLSTAADFKGRAFGTMTMAGQFGCLVGPMIGALVASTLAIRYQFIVSGSMLIVMSLYVIYRVFAVHQEKAAHAQEKL